MSHKNTIHPVRNLIRGLRKGKSRHIGRCNACGRKTVFFAYGAFTLTDMPFRNDLPCLFCKSVARQRAIIASLCSLYGMNCPDLRRFPDFLEKRKLEIYNAASQGTLHHFLRRHSRYTCSEFFPNVAKGDIVNGVRCEDLQSLTFKDGSFDIVISEDVLEHVRRPSEAFASIFRVLKPGGCHVFTVPIYGNKTMVRVDTSGDQDVFLLPKVYHGDPLRSEGALAYNDFGTDIVQFADRYGFKSAIVKHNVEDENWKCGHVIISQKPV